MGQTPGGSGFRSRVLSLCIGFPSVKWGVRAYGWAVVRIMWGDNGKCPCTGLAHLQFTVNMTEAQKDRVARARHLPAAERRLPCFQPPGPLPPPGEGFHRSWLCRNDRPWATQRSQPPSSCSAWALAAECARPRPLQALWGGSRAGGRLKRPRWMLRGSVHKGRGTDNPGRTEDVWGVDLAAVARGPSTGPHSVLQRGQGVCGL